jgi:hypothetical protein
MSAHRAAAALLVLSGAAQSFHQTVPVLRVPAASAKAPPAPSWARGFVAASAVRRGRDGGRHALRVSAKGDGTESARDAEELKTGVQLRTPDVDTLCSWLTEEITLWLDQDWIERDVHREMGERAAASVRQMVGKGDVGISAILFAVAEDLGAANFPRLFESDVNEWDVANKVSDLLLQSMRIDVCCTTAPLTGLPDYGFTGAVATAGTPTEAGGSFQVPVSSVDKYLFLQKSLDGRIPVRDVNAAVLLTLRYTLVLHLGKI